jgi:putative cell wall-binding protein
MSLPKRALSLLTASVVVAALGALPAHGADETPPAPTPPREQRVLEDDAAVSPMPGDGSRILNGVTTGTTTIPSGSAAPANQRSAGSVLAVGGTDVLSEQALQAIAYATDRQPQRAAGASRYETAVEVSRLGHPDGSEDVFIATSADFPDALAAGAYAGAVNGPILLSRQDSIDAATLAEVARLAPKRIHVAGSAGAVSESVVAQLATTAPTADVARHGGADRFETSAALSKAFIPTTTMAIVATGFDFPDALSASPAASVGAGALLLTRSAALPAPTSAELTRLRPKTTYVVGGPTVVSDDVLRQIKAITGGQVERLSGPDRYSTSAAISDRLFQPTTSSLVVARAKDFPDALAGGALAGARRSPLMLNPDGPNPARVSLDAARRVSWWYPASGRVLRYNLIAHPDDEMASRAVLGPRDPRRYDVNILMTRGEGTGYCNGEPINHAWADVEFTPQPQPRPLAFTEECKSHRLQSWAEFMNRSGSGAVGSYARKTGGPISFQGRQIPVPITTSEAGAEVPADYYDIAVGADSARVIFDMGALTPDEVLWALQQTRTQLSLFPTRIEGDVVGAGFVNTTTVGYPNASKDHVAIHDLLRDIDLELPGSQMSSVGHEQPGRTFGGLVADYCTMMCHPGLSSPYHTSAVGTFQYAYGWLDAGIWPAGELDVYAGFSRYQSFGKWH